MFSCCASVSAKETRASIKLTPEADASQSEATNNEATNGEKVSRVSTRRSTRKSILNASNQEDYVDPPVPKLWPKAQEVVHKTLSRQKAWTSMEERNQDLLHAMKSDPMAAQDLIQSFVDRSVMGIDLLVCRHTTAPAKGRFHLSQDLESWKLVVFGKEREVPMTHIEVISAWAPSAVTTQTLQHLSVEEMAFASIELCNGNAVSLLLPNQDECNELVMGLLILTACRSPHTQRLFEIFPDEENPESMQEEEEQEDACIEASEMQAERVYAEKAPGEYSMSSMDSDAQSSASKF